MGDGVATRRRAPRRCASASIRRHLQRAQVMIIHVVQIEARRAGWRWTNNASEKAHRYSDNGDQQQERQRIDGVQRPAVPARHLQHQPCQQESAPISAANRLRAAAFCQPARRTAVGDRPRRRTEDRRPRGRGSHPPAESGSSGSAMIAMTSAIKLGAKLQQPRSFEAVVPERDTQPNAKR